MGKEPLKENTNVYFQARKRASISNDRLFSRENAAELLGISRTHLLITNLEIQRLYQ